MVRESVEVTALIPVEWTGKRRISRWMTTFKDLILSPTKRADGIAINMDGNEANIENSSGPEIPEFNYKMQNKARVGRNSISFSPRSKNIVVSRTRTRSLKSLRSPKFGDADVVIDIVPPLPIMTKQVTLTHVTTLPEPQLPYSQPLELDHHSVITESQIIEENISPSENHRHSGNIEQISSSSDYPSSIAASPGGEYQHSAPIQYIPEFESEDPSLSRNNSSKSAPIVIPRSDSYQKRVARFRDIEGGLPLTTLQRPPAMTRQNSSNVKTPLDRGWGNAPHPVHSKSPTKNSEGSIFYPSYLKTSDEKITRESIWDILHFCHYAEMAYINFDVFEQSDLIISTSKKNDLFHAPFLISYDHEWRAIVISIRGTFSALDVLVDLKIDLEALDEQTPHLLAHSGMLKTARNIISHLNRDNIIEKYMTDAYKSYHIVVCGHSLGAVICI